MTIMIRVGILLTFFNRKSLPEASTFIELIWDILPLFSFLQHYAI